MAIRHHDLVEITGKLGRGALFDAGMQLIQVFNALNGIPAICVTSHTREDWPFAHCAYFRMGETRFTGKAGIHIALHKTSMPGLAGRCWSFPGYTVDKTPYGVLAHENGHYLDCYLSGAAHGYFGEASKQMRAAAREEPISSYCPNDAEWFAEMARVFMTNPDLLRRVRPKTFREFTITHGLKPVHVDDWRSRLAVFSAPERTIAAASRKVAA